MSSSDDGSIKDFKTIASAHFLHPDAQALAPKVHPCSICCTIFSLFAFVFLVSGGGRLAGWPHSFWADVPS